jgi:hypothetical protein
MPRPLFTFATGRTARFARLPIALSLVLLISPFCLQGQSCYTNPGGDVWCSPCDDNSAGCMQCGRAAGLAGTMCALTGNSYYGFCYDSVCCMKTYERTYDDCVNGLAPPSPPSPTPPDNPDFCEVQGQFRQGLSAHALQAHDVSSANCGIEFLDPVPDLQTADGKDVTSNNRNLGNLGTDVAAVSADSAARVVVRIGWRKVGEQVLVVTRRGLSPQGSHDNFRLVSQIRCGVAC